ncbi:MAG: exosortase C-terminal domain/associated protein EpsI [Candidatus Thiodiazotropha sp. 6PLUC1]
MTTREMAGDHILTGIVLFSCLVILTLVYHQTAVSLYLTWTAENSLQSHGLLLLPLSSYLLFREWYSRRQTLEVRFRPLFLIALLILSVIWLMSEIAQVQVASQILMILVLCITVFALFGIRESKTLAFPILILLSATSVWSVLSQPLQQPTAILVNQLLHLTGYTSFQESYFITIPEGIFEVGDTCSGLRYQIAAITLALIYAFFSQYSLAISLLYVLMASLIAFISNSIRIFIVVLSGHYTNMTHSLLEDHIWLGWVVFVICYASFMYATVLVEKRVLPEAEDEPGNQTDVGGRAGSGSYSKILMISSVLLLCASIGPLYSAFTEKSLQPQLTSKVLLNFKGLTQSPIDEAGEWSPAWVNADSETRASYSIQGKGIDFYSAYYAYQEQGKEAVNDLNRAYNSEIWQAKHRLDREINLDNGRKLIVLEEGITDIKGNERMVWSWYYIGGYVSSSKLQSKWHGILAGLKGNSDAAVIVLSTKKDGDGVSERAAMQEFINQTINEIESHYSE